jgi:hypothetical protein
MSEDTLEANYSISMTVDKFDVNTLYGLVEKFDIPLDAVISIVPKNQSGSQVWTTSTMNPQPVLIFGYRVTFSWTERV